MSLNLDLSDVLLWLDSDDSFLVRILHTWCLPPPLHPIEWRIISNCPVPDDVHFDHLRKVVSARLFHRKYIYFPSLSILWGSPLKVCKFPVPHQAFSVFSYLFISVWTCDFNVICYYNNLLWCSNYSQLSQWEPLQASFYVLLTYSRHSFATWFLVQKDAPGSSVLSLETAVCPKCPGSF